MGGAPQVVWPDGTFDQPTVSSPFGPRTAPIAGASTFHQGTDFINIGKVRAVAAGVVTVAGTPSGWGGGGNAVWVSHEVGGVRFLTRSLHLNAIGRKVGDRVVAGQFLGDEGMTGTATGKHLHFEVVLDGVQIDPVPFLRALIEEEDMPTAKEIARELLNYPMHGGNKMPNGRTVPTETLGERLRQIRRSTDQLQTRTLGIEETVSTQLTKDAVADVVADLIGEAQTGGLSKDDITDAVDEGFRRGIEGLTITTVTSNEAS